MITKKKNTFLLLFIMLISFLFLDSIFFFLTQILFIISISFLKICDSFLFFSFDNNIFLHNFSIKNLFLDVLNCKINIVSNLNSLFSDFSLNFYNQPLFLFFAIFFFLSTILVFFFSNFLGLYGVFFVIFMSISLF